MKGYEFGPEFEASVLRVCLLDPSFLPLYRDVLDPRFFSDLNASGVCSYLIAFWKRFKAVPSGDSLKLYIREQETDRDEVSRISLYIDEISSSGVSDSSFIKEKVVDFAKMRAVEDAILECSKLIQDGNYERIRRRMSEALAVGMGGAKLGYDYFAETISRFAEYGKGVIPGTVIATGIPPLDDCLDGGGLWAGELGLIQAPPEAGKTSLLVNIGYGALLQGLKVCHFTLEVSDRKLARRYDMRITGMTKAQLAKRRKTGATKVLAILKELKSGLDLKQFGTKTASSRDLAAHLEAMREIHGFRPNLLLVDYGEIMAPERRLEERYIEIGESYEALRALGKEFQCPVWSGSQTTREGLSVRTSDMRHTGGAFAKMQIADVVVTVNQEQRARDTIPVRLFIAKNREEKSGGEILVNFTRSTQTIIAP